MFKFFQLKTYSNLLCKIELFLKIFFIQMTKMDGYEFLTKVRQRGFTKHTPFIMLSARAESKERIKCYKLGAQDYLTKPFNPEELEELVKKNLFPVHFALAW